MDLLFLGFVIFQAFNVGIASSSACDSAVGNYIKKRDSSSAKAVVKSLEGLDHEKIQTCLREAIKQDALFEYSKLELLKALDKQECWKNEICNLDYDSPIYRALINLAYQDSQTKAGFRNPRTSHFITSLLPLCQKKVEKYAKASDSDKAKLTDQIIDILKDMKGQWQPNIAKCLESTIGNKLYSDLYKKIEALGEESPVFQRLKGLQDKANKAAAKKTAK